MSSVLDWSTFRPVTRADRTLAYFQLPAFSITGITWLGASTIQRQYNYAASKNFSLIRRPTKPANADYVLCIRYRIGTTVYRYKLWDDANLRLPNVNLYSGEVIKKNFVLECYNLKDTTTLTQASALTLQSGIHQPVSSFSATPANSSDATGAQATIAIGANNLGNPSNYGTLGVWFKADTGVTHAGGSISQWADQSGNGVHLVNTNTPTYVSSGFGLRSQPYVRINGDAVLQNASTSVAMKAIYMAIRIPGWVINSVVLDNGARVVTMQPSSNNLRCSYHSTTADIDYSSVASAEFILRLDQRNVPNTTNRVQIVAMTDYLTQIAATEQTAANPATPAPTKFVLGDGVAGVKDIRIAEILAYDASELSDANDKNVKAYLSAKYSGFTLPLSFDDSNDWEDNAP